MAFESQRVMTSSAMMKTHGCKYTYVMKTMMCVCVLCAAVLFAYPKPRVGEIGISTMGAGRRRKE